MKRIKSNKKWINIIVLFLLILLLNSCSAIGYWWGDVSDDPFDFDTPTGAAVGSSMATLTHLIALDEIECNFVSFIVGFFWLFGSVSALMFLVGLAGTTIGVKEHSIYDKTGTEKLFTVRDTSEARYTPGTKKDGLRCARMALLPLFFIILLCFLYNSITGWFDDLNMFFKLIIGILTAIISFKFTAFLSSYLKQFKLICWAFCAIDLILGILVTLWIN